MDGYYQITHWIYAGQTGRELWMHCYNLEGANVTKYVPQGVLVK